MRSRGATPRMVEIETPIGRLCFGIWADGWVIAYRGDACTESELFDVFAKGVADLVRPLVAAGLTERDAVDLAGRMIDLRAEMDAAGL